MGRTYLFECGKCGFKAKVSGRADQGFDFSVQTILCRDCKKLYDAITRWKVPDEPAEPAPTPARKGGGRLLRRNPEAVPTFDEAVNQLAVTKVKKLKWVPFKPRCPVSAVHRIQPWTDPGKCPRCGTYLERNALPFRIWE